jgi:hypothetical protein
MAVAFVTPDLDWPVMARAEDGEEVLLEVGRQLAIAEAVGA